MGTKKPLTPICFQNVSYTQNVTQGFDAIYTKTTNRVLKLECKIPYASKNARGTNIEKFEISIFCSIQALSSEMFLEKNSEGSQNSHEIFKNRDFMHFEAFGSSPKSPDCFIVFKFVL